MSEGLQLLICLVDDLSFCQLCMVRYTLADNDGSLVTKGSATKMIFRLGNKFHRGIADLHRIIARSKSVDKMIGEGIFDLILRDGLYRFVSCGGFYSGLKG